MSVKVYRRLRADGVHGYEVADYSSGKRRLRSYADADEALAEAKRLARQIARGDAVAASMDNGDARAYGRAVDALKPTGVSLEVAIAHFVESFTILGADKVVAASHYYKEKHPDNLKPATVAAVVAELLKSKEGKREENTISDLRARLNTFAESFKCPIASVTTADVQAWLDGLKASERTRINYRNKVFQLFRFAERRNYIAKRSNPVVDTEKIEAAGGEIEIYTPSELSKLLSAAPAEFLPCAAIQAFAGLRSGEVQRLDWKDINFEEGLIRASAKKKGTPSNRYVPISATLKAWLTPIAKKSGLIWKDGLKDRNRAEDYFSDAQAATAEAAKVPWKANALRHSWISNRVAETNDVPKTALEAGNSVGTIHKHYRQLVSAKQAATYFSVLPTGPENVVHLKRKAA